MKSTSTATRCDLLHAAFVAGLAGAAPALAAGEPPNETRRIRLGNVRSTW